MSEERLERIEDMVTTLISRVGKISAEQFETKSEISSMKSEMTTIKSEISTMKSEIHSVKELIVLESEKNDKRFEQLFQELGNMRSDIQYLAAKDAQHELNIDRLKRHIF